MNLKPIKYLFLIASLFILTACNPDLLKYKLDPDFGSLEQLAGKSEIVAVQVSDKRTKQPIPTGDIKLAPMEDEATILNKRLIEQMKDLDYKIINKPLLADLAIMMDINELTVSIQESTFKSTVKANSVFTLTIRRNGEEWRKIFRAARTQEVANPVNQNDATGVINQLLSKQLSNAFSDPALMEFLSKSAQQSGL
ncbi:MAG: YajG family lipoprotein [Kangiellaceae bacterium]